MSVVQTFFDSITSHMKCLPTLSTLVPIVGKLFVASIFLLNMRSWPFVWHVRIFRPYFEVNIAHSLKMLCAKLTLKSPKEKAEIDRKFWEGRTPVGENPFNGYTPYKTIASFDDSDFNGHLSNSSYAKTLDAVRFKAVLEMFPLFFRAGGWMPLAGTCYNFVHEIPMLSKYEVYTGIAAWDNKWLYLVCKFVCKKGKKSSKSKGGEKKADSASSSGSELTSSTDTPAARLTEVAPVDPTLVNHTLINSMHLNTVVVSQLCFKVGRITVPPALVLALNGFTGQSDTSSLENPHPEWEEVRKIAFKSHGGNEKKFRHFMAGGWKEVQEGEQWWLKEGLLGGKIEEQRKRNLEVVEKLKTSLEISRSL